MTDLERARSELLDIVACAYQGIWTQPLIARVTEILAAARREGVKAAQDATHEKVLEMISLLKRDRAEDERRGAEEMRERAARTVLAGSRGGIRGEIADTIRALPLMPEEPT